MSLAWDRFCSFGSPLPTQKRIAYHNLYLIQVFWLQLHLFRKTRLLTLPCSFALMYLTIPANLLPSTPTKSLLNLRQTAIYTFILDVHKDNTLLHRAHMSYYCVWFLFCGLWFYRYVGINATEINHSAGRYNPGVPPPFDGGLEVSFKTDSDL